MRDSWVKSSTAERPHRPGRERPRDSGNRRNRRHLLLCFATEISYIDDAIRHRREAGHDDDVPEKTCRSFHVEATLDSPRILFTYDRKNRVRIATYTGIIDDACLLQAYEDLIQRADFDPFAHDLADLRGVERIDVTTEGLRALGHLLSGGGSLPLPPAMPGLAIVATGPSVYGLARMYELMTQGYLPKETRTFRDYEEALGWLLTQPLPPRDAAAHPSP
jgi:hypothetical protein